MDFLCACLRKKEYTKIDEKEPEPEPAQYISASDDSEYGIKSTFSSIYKKMSEWSLPKSRQVNLFTLNEDEHDFLINDVDVPQGPAPSPASQEENFDDVVDKLVQ
jgi:hypothetical protein